MPCQLHPSAVSALPTGSAQQWEGDLSASARNRSPDQMEEKLPGASQVTEESRCPENGNVLRLRSSSLGLSRSCVAACDLCVPISFNKAQATIIQLGRFLHPELNAGYYGT